MSRLAHKPTHFSFPLLISSQSLRLSVAQQAGQMAAPRPTVPGKACELKVIPSRSEELPASWLWSRGVRRGCPSPPASQALGHLSGVLWNDERAAANHRRCHRGRHRAGRRRRRLFSFSACKWTNEQVSVVLLASVCLRAWMCVYLFYLDLCEKLFVKDLCSYPSDWRSLLL